MKITRASNVAFPLPLRCCVAAFLLEVGSADLADVQETISLSAREILHIERSLAFAVRFGSVRFVEKYNNN